MKSTNVATVGESVGLVWTHSSKAPDKVDKPDIALRNEGYTRSI